LLPPKRWVCPKANYEDNYITKELKFQEVENMKKLDGKRKFLVKAKLTLQNLKKS